MSRSSFERRKRIRCTNFGAAAVRTRKRIQIGEAVLSLSMSGWSFAGSAAPGAAKFANTRFSATLCARLCARLCANPGLCRNDGPSRMMRHGFTGNAHASPKWRSVKRFDQKTGEPMLSRLVLDGRLQVLMPNAATACRLHALRIERWMPGVDVSRLRSPPSVAGCAAQTNDRPPA